MGKHILHRSGLVGGVLAAAMVAAEIGGRTVSVQSCQPLSVTYDGADGGHIVAMACLSVTPVVAPVIVHCKLELHLVIGTRRSG